MAQVQASIEGAGANAKCKHMTESGTANKCPATRADDTPCKAWATADGFCFWHSAAQRSAVLAAARKGGLRRTIELPSAPALTAERTRELIASVSESVVAGSLDPNTARALTYLLGLDRQLRDSEGLEVKVAELQAQISRLVGVKGFEASNGHEPRRSRLKRVGDQHVK